MSPGSYDEATEHLPSDVAARLNDLRFTPGTIIGERFRVISLLGQGGMGEVYGADDMTLGQRVALKRLPRHLAARPGALERLYAEVRIGRQISHPNVCRLYDIIEAGGHRFISMEYIDGEDLASLLRRIGRVAPDKALWLARDICAGVAAAHAKGVIHRDLKPANIMIDGRGRAIVTDFGLAVPADEEHRGEMAGTPGYMAPEQLSRGEATVSSDVYALGLILYEIFTGKKVFSGASTEELSAQHAVPKSRPASIVKELDPDIERLILRCIEESPGERPKSVREVIAGLPGGEAIDAMIAAGDTPTPGMVAAAGDVGELPAAKAWSFLGITIALLLLVAWVGDRSLLTAFTGEIKSPQTLRDRARDVIRELGYDDRRVSTHTFIRTDNRYLRWFGAKRGARWSDLGLTPPSAIRFHSRQSPVPLVTYNIEGRVYEDDPPENLPGMSTVILDQGGKLRYFRRVSPERVEEPRTVKPDWGKAFLLADLDIRQFTPASPVWVPPYGHDERMAWTGKYPGAAGMPIRVEAASLAGRAVYFHVVQPWEEPVAPLLKAGYGWNVFAIVTFASLVAGAIFARRNIVRGRGDRRGAFRVAAALTVILFAGRVFGAHHSPRLAEEWDVLCQLGMVTLFRGATIWLLYLAVEPYVRRRWPHILIAWTRLVAGRFRDPLVGREILLGSVAGAVSALAAFAMFPTGSALGLRGAIPSNPLTHFSTTLPMGFGAIVMMAIGLGIMLPLIFLTLLVVVAPLLRSDVAALTLICILVSLVGWGVPAPLPVRLVIGTLSMGTLVYALYKFGAVACGVGMAVRTVLITTPLTFDAGSWYFLRSAEVLVLLAALAIVGFYVSLGGKPILGRLALEEEPAAAR